MLVVIYVKYYPWPKKINKNRRASEHAWSLWKKWQFGPEIVGGGVVVLQCKIHYFLD